MTTDPLRRVIETNMRDDGTLREVLECGHVQGVKRDIFGYTSAARRRCRKCGEAERLKDL